VLHDGLPDFAADTIANSGVYVHEERPDAVVQAILALADDSRHAVVAALNTTSH
jgi:pimeloyl-ACP methyl ester carboxylesterase